jgi:hypothetical protein
MLKVMRISRLVWISSAFCAAAAIGCAQSAQTTQSPLPNEKPAVFDGKRNPKEDKSRLRNLTGVVQDDRGVPVDGAIVQLKNLKTGTTIDFITKKDGAYSFSDLNMDIDYELTAKRDGYGDPVKKKLTKYDTRKPAILNFELSHKA